MHTTNTPQHLHTQRPTYRWIAGAFVVLVLGCAGVLYSPHSAEAAAENLRPQSHNDAIGRTTSETNAYDTDTSTQSDTLYGGNNNIPSLQIFDWPSGDSGGTTNGLTLEVEYEAQAGAGDDTYEIEYSTDNTAGTCDSATWTDLVAPTTAAAADSTIASTSLSGSQDYTAVCIRINEAKVGSPDANRSVYLEDVRIVRDFVPPPPTLSGTVYMDNGSTTATNTQNIKIAIGTSTLSLHATTSSTTGEWSFQLAAGYTMGAGTPVVVWIDGSSTTTATTFTKAQDNIANIENLDLYKNRAIVRHEAYSGTSTRIADMAFYDSDDDPDIGYIANGSVLDVRSPHELYLWFKPNGETWSPTASTDDSGTTWRGITYGSSELGDNRFVAVADGGGKRVMYSKKGSDWFAASSSQQLAWRDVAYGNGRFVAVAADGTRQVMYSDDGASWTTASSSEQNPWQALVYGADDSRFVAVATSGTSSVMYSSSGDSWTWASSSEDNSWRDVTYGEGRFVAVASDGTSRVMYSDDGISWSNASSSEQLPWVSVTYGEGRFVAVAESGTSSVMYSDDGVNWTAASSSEQNSWQSVTFGKSRFVAVSSDGTNRVMYSKDGETWTAATAATANTWQDVAYGKGRFISVANSGSNRVMISTSLNRFEPGGEVTVRGNGVATSSPEADTDGSIYLDENVIFTAGGTTTVAGHLEMDDDAVFAAGENPTIFNATSTGKTVSGEFTGKSKLKKLKVNGNQGEWEFNGNADVKDVDLDNGTFKAPNQSLKVRGNYNNNGGEFRGNGGTMVVEPDLTSPSWEQLGGDGTDASWADSTYEYVYSLESIDDTLYAGLGSGTGDAEVWELDDAGWSKVGGDGLNGSWAASEFETVTALTSANEVLYVGLGSGTGDAEVWSYDGSSWSKIGGDAVNSSWADTTFEEVDALFSLNGTLYAGLGGDAGDAEVWSYDGSSWTKIGGDAVNSSWADSTFEYVHSLSHLDDVLYAGLGASTGDAEVWKWNGTSWTQVGGDAVNSSWADSTFEGVMALENIDDETLYAGLASSTGDAEVWSYDGESWSKVGGDGVNSSWADSTYEYVNTLTSVDQTLYAGLGASAGDAEVWEYDGTSWSVLGGDAINSSWADSTYEYTRALAVIDGAVYAGLGSGTGDGEVWEMAGATSTLAGTMTGSSTLANIDFRGKASFSQNASTSAFTVGKRAVIDAPSAFTIDGDFNNKGRIRGNVDITIISNEADYVAGRDTAGNATGKVGEAILAAVEYGDYLFTGGTGNSVPCSDTPGQAQGCEIRVWDITDRDNPVYVAGADTSGADAGTGSLVVWDMDIYNDHLFVSKLTGNSSSCNDAAGEAEGCEIMVFDISDPENPTFAAARDSDGATSGSYDVSTVGIEAAKDHLFVAVGGGQTGTCGQTPGTGDGCEMLIFDISNPASPSYVAGRDADGGTGSGGRPGSYDVAVKGDYLYWSLNWIDPVSCSASAGSAEACEIHVYDISTPSNPSFVTARDADGDSGGSFAEAVTKVYVAGDYLYAGKDVDKHGAGSGCGQTPGTGDGCEIMIFDISNPASPSYVAGRDSDGAASGNGNEVVWDFQYEDDRLYVGKGSNSTACSQTAGSAVGCELIVFDSSDRENPVYVIGRDADGSKDGATGEGFRGLQLYDDKLYVGKTSDNTPCSQAKGSARGCEFMTFSIGRHLDGKMTGNNAFPNLTIRGNGNVYFDKNASTTGLTIETTENTVTMPDAVSIAGDYANNSTGNVDFPDESRAYFDGAGDQSLSGTMVGENHDFANIIFKGSGVKSFLANASSSDFIINTGVEVEAPDALSVAGSYINNGTFTASSGIVYFDGEHDNQWTKAGGDGVNDSWPDNTYEYVNTLAAANRTVYAGLGSGPAEAEVWAYDGRYWEKIGGDNFRGSWGSGYEAVFSLVAEGDDVYAGLAMNTGDAEVWHWGGKRWKRIGGDGVNSSWADSTYEYVNSLAVENGTLYAGLGVDAGDAEVWEYNGSSWTKIGGDAVNSSWADSTFEYVRSLETMGGDLYAGLGSGVGDAEVWQWNGSSWSKIGGDGVNSSWADSTYEIVNSFTESDGTLYAGLSYSTGNAEVWTWNGSSWTKVGGDGVNGSWPDSTYESVDALTAANGAVYAGLGENVGDAEVWRYYDGSWEKIGGDGRYSSWADSTYELSRSLVAANGKVFMGLGSHLGTAGHAEVWSVEALDPQTVEGTHTGSSTFNDLTFIGSSTKTFTSNFASTSDFIVKAGAGTTSLATTTSIAGNYTNESANPVAFIDNGTTTFNGTSQQTATGTMTGASELNNVEITNTSGTHAQNDPAVIVGQTASSTGSLTIKTPGVMVQFQEGATTTWKNMSLQGSTTDYVYLRSTTIGKQWNVAVRGTSSVNYVYVKHSNACENPSGNIYTNNSVDSAGGNTCWDNLSEYGEGATISSAANQVFYVGQATTSIEEITVTASSTPNITAANDLRIAIATATVDMRWDTTDTEATFGGTAAGKVSNPVSYEGNGSVLVIPVDSDFAADETLTISDLSYAQFGAINIPLSALEVRTDGPGDTLNNRMDNKTVAITGTLTLADSDAGQADDNVSFKNETDVELFTFKLIPAEESSNIGELIIELSGIDELTESNLSNIALYRDTDVDGVYDTGEPQVGGGGALSINDKDGTVTFSSSFLSTTTGNYVMVADTNSVDAGTIFTLDLTPSGVTASGTQSESPMTSLGSVSSIQQSRNAGFGGGSIGIAAPVGRSTTTGGGEGGGEAIGDDEDGENIAANPNFFQPTSNGATFNQWTDPANAYNSDGSDASAASDLLRQSYAGFNFSIPADNTIEGIEIKIDAADSAGSGGLVQVALSWDGGTSSTTLKSTGSLGTTDVVYVLGGSADTWGRSWTPSEFSTSNFEVIIESDVNSSTNFVDGIEVRVYHQTGGGGSGGGGSI